MSAVSLPSEQRVVLDNIQWSTYLAILDDVENRRGRITYDQGTLEIMSPSKPHENITSLLGRSVESFTEVMGIDIQSIGSTTFKREDFKQGFEADKGYYIQNAESVRGKDEVDLTIDPPPDLVIEIEISRSSIGKLAIFKAMGIPEVWRYDRNRLRIFVLRGNDYEEAKQSAVLPGFPISDVEHLLGERTKVGETELIRRFRASLKQD